MEQLNTYDSYHAIADKVESGESDFANEIAMLEELQATEQELFVSSVEFDTELISQVNDILSSSKLAEHVETLRGLVA